MIYPVPGEHEWTRRIGPDIEPPKFHVKRGRKKEKRIKGRFEVPKPKDSSRMATITCINCGLQVHRHTNCRQQLRPELALRKNKHVAPTRPRSEARSQPPPARPTRPSTEARSQPPPARPTRPSSEARSQPQPARSTRRPFTTPRFAVGGSSSSPAPTYAAGGSSSAPAPTNHSGWMAYFTASGKHH
ncbi:hypothetical protein D1007_31382 [Hordeum vulgare]|nr:hypothetical protein D1007_31382 [Hordeum vulgare]